MFSLLFSSEHKKIKYFAPGSLVDASVVDVEADGDLCSRDN